MSRIALINPKFEVSYWGQEYAMPIFGKKANMPVSALPLLAALTPSNHEVTIIDENVEDIDYEALADIDIVGMTGMSVQRFRMKEILKELKRRDKFTIVGGAWVTVQEKYFDGLADVVFIGEADDSWPLFLKDWENGHWQTRYEQVVRTNMRELPIPNWNLIRMDSYLYGSIQLSRGCPFLCEFCDIIVTFGRLPRVKTSSQVIAELETLKLAEVSQIFIVDDNLIGNKSAVKEILKEVISYQEDHAYPFRFLTEASLDLAEDDEMMDLMVAANITTVFIGIESPNEDSLKETRKYQNVRPKAGNMIQRVQKIQEAGMEVTCGMIVGFDSDSESIFEAQQKFVTDAAIAHVMIGMLYAIPKTPLYDRLRSEGRLDTLDVSEYGTNVIPLQLSRVALRNGYVRVMQNLHDSSAFLGRVEALYVNGGLAYAKWGRLVFWKNHPWKEFVVQIKCAFVSLALFLRLIKHVTERELQITYIKRIITFGAKIRNPVLFLAYIAKCAIHYHNYKLSQGLTKNAIVNTM